MQRLSLRTMTHVAFQTRTLVAQFQMKGLGKKSVEIYPLMFTVSSTHFTKTLLIKKD